MTEITKENKSIKKVPNLRFPEFEEEWMEKKLGSIALKVGSGKTPRGGEKVYDSIGIPFIRSQNVLNNQLLLDDIHIPLEVHEEMKGSTVYSEDILLNITGGSIGRSCVVPKEFIEGNVNQHVSIIRLKKDNPYFLQFILSSWRGQKLIYQSQTGSGREGLNFESIKNFKISFPFIDEQNKIASFLSLLNSRIQTQNKIITQLELYFKSIRDNIFTQKIRFKNNSGNSFSNWKKTNLKELCEKQSSNISANKIENNYGEFPIYGATGVLKNIDFYQIETEYIAIIKDGAGVGRLFLCEPKSSVLGTLDVIKPKNINLYFLYYLLSNIRFNKYTTGSTIPHIYFKDYKNEVCMIPSEEEQTKIASFLSSINEKIQTEKEVLKQLENQKKHLLQNMFV